MKNGGDTIAHFIRPNQPTSDSNSNSDNENKISYSFTTVQDLEGKAYPLQATFSYQTEINSDQSLETTILPTKVNKQFIQDIAEMWTLTDHDDIDHRIIYAKRKGKGDKMTVDIKAIPLFFDVLDNDRLYERFDGSMTVVAAFDKIFKDTGFGYSLVDSFEASSWENFGNGETKLAMFQKALEHYKCEFRIVGKTVYLEEQVGRDTQFQYRHKLNASDIEQEIDAEEMWTYAKGYGDYDDTAGDEDDGEAWEEANIKMEYESPLVDILGKRHAPPVKDGRVKHESTMKKKLKELVDESVKISVSATIQDLRYQGYPLAQPRLGDRSFLIDGRIGLKEEVRVISMTYKKDWRGKIIDLNVTFGNEGLSKRHQSNIDSAVNDINDLFNGKKKIPYSILDDTVKNATKALKDAQTELKFTENGILAVDKDDPNNVVLFNSAGIGISNDGGSEFRNALTGNGLVADVVTSGTLNTDNVVVRGGDEGEYIYMNGPEIETRGNYDRQWFGDMENADVGIQLKQGHLRFFNYDSEKRLYYSDKGISTFKHGYDDESDDAENKGSGVIEFFSHMYDDVGEPGEDNVRGLTLFSNKGTIGLRTEKRDIILDAYRNTVVTNGTLKTSTIDVYGDDKNFYVGVNGERGGELRVTNRYHNNDGNPSYKDIQVKDIRAHKFINRKGGFAYIGSDGGLRVTSRGTNSNSPIIYRVVQAKDFKERSSRKSKENIRKCDIDGTKELNDLWVKSFNHIGDNEERIGFEAEESPFISGKDDEGEFISHGQVLGLLTKALQETTQRLDKLEA